jgi:hypothetical protein
MTAALEAPDGSESGSDEVDTEPEHAMDADASQPKKLGWRTMKKMRQDEAAASRKAGRERHYRRMAENAETLAVSRRAGKTKADSKPAAISSPLTKPLRERNPSHPVHALIPTTTALSDDSDSIESVDEVELPSNIRGRDQPITYMRTGKRKTLGNSEIEDFSSADEEDVEEGLTMKRGRGRPTKEEAAQKRRRLGSTTAGGSNSDLRSLSNGSLESEDETLGEGTDDLESLRVNITSAYGTRASANKGK